MLLRARLARMSVYSSHSRAAIVTFRSGFTQALVLGPLIGLGQAMGLRGVSRRWAWWIVANLTTYLSGTLLHHLIELLVRDGLSFPTWMTYYFPVLAFVLYGAWMLWITAPRATPHRAATPRD